jgi:transcriptional regulator with XRE-family HTH domain
MRLRNKMMGVLLQEARKASGKSLRETALACGLPAGTIVAFENGRKAITLPELEALAYCYDVSARHLLTGSNLGADDSRERVDMGRWVAIRQKMISTRIRQMRIDHNLKPASISAKTGIPTRRITAYENGARPIPLPDLESIALALEMEPSAFLDYQGPIGVWEKGRESLERFDALPADIQEFVSLPLHEPFVRIAMQLSELPARRLREIAEALLDISL